MIPSIVTEARRTITPEEWRTYSPEHNAQLQYESEIRCGFCPWFPALSRLMLLGRGKVAYVDARWQLADGVDATLTPVVDSE